MKLQHKFTWLWKESGLLNELLRDQSGNLQPLKVYIKQLRKAADILAIKHPLPDTDRHDYYGWMGEVLCEFWLRLFGQEIGITSVQDTSENKFTRGYDFTAVSTFSEALVAQIQVKMRSREWATLKEGDLYTFLDEGHKAGVLPQYLVLMVPTMNGVRRETLSYLDDFRQRGYARFCIITGADMAYRIDRLPSSRNKSGLEEFLLQFRDAVMTS